MKITTNIDVNKRQELFSVQEVKLKEEGNGVAVKSKGENTAVSLDITKVKNTMLTDTELQCAIENVLATSSSIWSVEQAEEMIKEANMRILGNSDEAVLAQANQEPPVVAELTK